jgi:hypothetical protein
VKADEKFQPFAREPAVLFPYVLRMAYIGKADGLFMPVTKLRISGTHD